MTTHLVKRDHFDPLMISAITVGLLSLFLVSLAIWQSQIDTLPTPKKVTATEAVILSSANLPKTTPNLIFDVKEATPDAKIVTAVTQGIKIPILTYHYIGLNPNPKDTLRFGLSVTPENFEAQLAHLQEKGYTTINLPTLYKIFSGEEKINKPVVLTFDDGYVDFYVNAYPLLKKYHSIGVVFIPTSLMNQGYYLSWDRIKEMSDSGLIEIEDHSSDHIMLTKVSYNKVVEELKTSKEKLESEIGKPVNFVAYPYGAVNNTVTKAAQAAGYVGGVGTWYGYAESVGLNMPRITINGYTSLTSFKARFK